MQELAGRLTALDPEASASLKVIGSFDALVAGGVGVEALVRAAAVLGGTAAGARVGRTTTRVDADGRAATSGEPGTWVQTTEGERTVWLEREGAPHANDAMILERLALAVDVVQSRHGEPIASAVEVLIDGSRHPDEQERALRRIRMDAGHGVLVVASWADGPAPVGGASTVLSLGEGLLRATLADPAAPVADRWAAGVATAENPASIAGAWHDARLLLRLSTPRTRVVRSDDVGALIVLIRAYDPAAPRHPDVEALRRLDDGTLRVLDELATAESVRAAATALSMHHSTLQARHDALTRSLGYDPRSAHGRSRYDAARLLSRLGASGRS